MESQPNSFGDGMRGVARWAIHPVTRMETRSRYRLNCTICAAIRVAFGRCPDHGFFATARQISRVRTTTATTTPKEAWKGNQSIVAMPEPPIAPKAMPTSIATSGTINQ